MIQTDGQTDLQEDVDIELPQEVHTRLASTIQDRFRAAETGRRSDETRWIDAYHNFRGVYGKDIKFRETEKSRVFVKITKTKTIAAYGQLVEVIFAGNKFPISVQETRVPEGIEEYARLNPLKDKTGDMLNKASPNIEGSLEGEEVTGDNLGNLETFDLGFEGDGKTLAPGAIQTSEDSNFLLGGLQEEFTNEAGDVILEAGAGVTPEMITVKPAQIAARRMEKLIHDQIEESNGATELRSALFESVLLGTGIIKGPFNYNKTLHKWTSNEDSEKREYKPESVRVPKLEFVSVWDFYPDPNATSLEDAEWSIQRHKFNKSQLRALMNRPYFNKENIAHCLRGGYNYEEKAYESSLDRGDTKSPNNNERFEVLEYWGTMDAEFVREAGLAVADDIDDLEEVQVNAWICNGKILRLVLNPFKPYRLPYQLFPYERNPYSIWGVGVPENMTDAQNIMNGHARMAIDNLALSGSLVFDIDEAALVQGQSMEIYPGKIFKRQAGMPGQAVHGLKFPSTATENMAMFDKFRQLADESTGIPSYSHGSMGPQAMTRTASGMSMLMGAASLNIKTVVKNLDDFLLKPLGVSYYQWNMQFYKGDLNITGDLEVKATGTSSLIQKEVRSQRLTTLLQTVQNPAVAPLVKLPTILRELAYSMDVDPEEIINSPEEAAIYAEIIGLQNASQQSPLEAGGGVPAGASAADITGAGGGTIGTGGAPMSGEMGFAGANATPQDTNQLRAVG